MVISMRLRPKSWRYGRHRTTKFVVAALAVASLPAFAQAVFGHPIVPGFERLYGENYFGRTVDGGLVLFGELGCASCHRAQETAGVHLLAKQAPILDEVGSRVRPEYLQAFILNPQAAKPGTTMPNLFDGWPETERNEAIEALTHFLASTGSVVKSLAERPRADDGEGLYHQVGCVACHGSRRAEDPSLSTSVPLGDLSEKYTIESLTDFLNDPHKVRPSGRMPGFAWKNGDQPRALAHYLVQDSKPTKEQNPFVLNLERAAKGRELFATVGCANCHAMNYRGERVERQFSAKSQAELAAGSGCLTTAPARGRPHFALDAKQIRALTDALGFLGKPPVGAAPEQVVFRTFTALNCFACHERNKLGGVEEARNALFQSVTKEMGDEGRLPPSLTGVGAKLTKDWLEVLWKNGPKVRPYMLTQMPKFGQANVGALTAALETLDTVEPVTVTPLAASQSQVKKDGRYMVGAKAFGCIKCHNFNGVASPGIQAIDLVNTTGRLKHDWFHRYLADPQVFRPGTRMPSAWPTTGKSYLPAILDGDVTSQIEAVWSYLLDRDRAVFPEGLGRDPIELIADREPVIYRNFIEGAGRRGIAVGYPEKANLAFDADDMRLALVWQGPFIDASRHWYGRGEGFQRPLGDNVVRFVEGASFAVLATPSEPWPTKHAKELGYQWRGYRLTKQGRPIFLYDYVGVHFDDEPQPLAGNPPSFKRAITLTATAPLASLYYRVAKADKIEPQADGWFRIDNTLRLRITGCEQPVIRGNELLAPINFAASPVQIVQEYVW